MASKVVAKIVHCGLVAANELTRLEEAQHFCRWRQQEVAKIVHCGEKLFFK